MITFHVTGSYKKTRRMLEKAEDIRFKYLLEMYGQRGVDALASATPKLTGKTADSWTYEVEAGRKSAAIYWTNTNVNKNVNIAVILHYGHGTGTGGYVRGREYIDAAIQPVFDEIAAKVWEEVVE